VKAAHETEVDDFVAIDISGMGLNVIFFEGIEPYGFRNRPRSLEQRA
jgi:hypothetical protein